VEPDPGSELVDVVDADDRVLRTVTRAEMRRDRLRHRCTFVVVRTSDGGVLVHRRSEEKDLWPGAWDLAVGGVVTAGEDWESAARRELAEEVGIEGVDLVELGRGRYRDDHVDEVARGATLSVSRTQAVLLRLGDDGFPVGDVAARRGQVFRGLVEAELLAEVQAHLGSLNDAAVAKALLAELARTEGNLPPALLARADGIVTGWIAARVRGDLEHLPEIYFYHYALDYSPYANLPLRTARLLAAFLPYFEVVSVGKMEVDRFVDTLNDATFRLEGGSGLIKGSISFTFDARSELTDLTTESCGVCLHVQILNKFL
jgi:8-oxo-dGTP pyrophosphatase MutT (NUDIX family)